MRKYTEKEKVLSADISVYKKNKFGANLALLGLVFNCLYFMLLYGIKVPLQTNNEFTKFCSIDIGISVVLTLIMLLAAFLSSEGVKGYNKKFCIVLLVLAVFQVIRIFGIPLYGLREKVLRVNYFGAEPTWSGINGFIFTMLLIWLLASAACFIASAVISYLRCVALEKHTKALESGEINMNELLADMDAEEAANAAAAEAAPAPQAVPESEEVK